MNNNEPSSEGSQKDLTNITDNTHTCWFVKYKLHTILAAVLSTLIATLGGSHIASKVSQANLIKAFSPELLSENPKHVKMALYAIEYAISSTAKDELIRILGTEYADKTLQGGDKESESYLDKAAYISPELYKELIKQLKNADIKSQPMLEKREKLLTYKPSPYSAIQVPVDQDKNQ